MAESGNVGKLNVEIGANVQPLKQAMGEAKTVTQQAASSMGADAQQGGAAVKEGFEKASEGGKGFIGTMKEIHHVFKYVLLPLMLARHGLELVRQFVEARKASDEFKVSLEEAFEAYQKVSRAGAIKMGLSRELQEVEEVRRRAAEATQKVNDEAVARFNSMKSTQIFSLGTSWLWNYFAGGLTPDEVLNEASETINRINQLAVGDVKRLKAFQDKRELDEFWKAANEQLEGFRAKQEAAETKRLETALDNIDKEARAREKAADQYWDNQRKNIEAVNSAVTALFRTQRGVADANKLAIDINRLAAAMEDLARSPRSPGVLNGSVW